jgi:antagonist of KipI
LTSGVCTLLVDRGRFWSRSLGVPVGGSADHASLSLGNALLGNPLDAPGLEISLAGPSLRADEDLGCVLFGAPFEMTLSGQEVRVGKTFTLPAGETLAIGGTGWGLRAYLCVKGGLSGPVILGSQSSLQPLGVGAQLGCTAGRIESRYFVHSFSWNAEPHRLRYLPGAQASWFPEGALLGKSFGVTRESNRMGVRLKGEALPTPGQEMVSEPVCPGTVQVTRDGECIVLGVDGQTIGGYPKIAHVISADLDKLGQLRPGETIEFKRVNLEEAETIYRDKQTELSEWLTRLCITLL